MARNPLWQFLKRVARDIDEQIWHKSGPHGAAELGAGLFNNGHAYVMYGHGRPPGEPPPPAAEQKPEQQQSAKADPAPEPEQQPDRGRKGRNR